MIRVAVYGVTGIVTLALVHFNGVSIGEAKIEKKYLINQIELTEQLAEHKRKFNESLDANAILEQALIEALKEDDEKAINDPESTNLCIGLDGVRRLNKGFGLSTSPIEVDPDVQRSGKDQPEPQSGEPMAD